MTSHAEVVFVSLLGTEGLNVQVKKSVAQRFTPSPDILVLMHSFSQMVNDCIRIGLVFEKETGRFAQSRRKEGGAGEAVKGNQEHEGEPVILRVNPSKFRRWGM